MIGVFATSPVPTIQGCGYSLVGMKEMIVDRLGRLTSTGLDGMLLSWPRYLEGMAQFQAETRPLLVEAGLR